MHETQYNYTLNHAATQLAMIFEGLSQQQQDLDLLEQKLKYDRLGVNDALLQFEKDLAQRTLPEPERLLPVLDRIAADTRVVDVARQRARALAERIRTSQTPEALSRCIGRASMACPLLSSRAQPRSAFPAFVFSCLRAPVLREELSSS